MNQITKIINWAGRIEVHHSDSILDKRSYYTAKFNSVYKGYTDYYVDKKRVQTKNVVCDNLFCNMYIPTSKFLEDPQKWINIFKDAYNKNYGKYTWFKDLIDDESYLNLEEMKSNG